MKKYLLPVLTGIAAVGLLFAGCSQPTIGTFNNQLNGTQANETTLYTTVTTAMQAPTVSVAAPTVLPAAFANIYQAKNQVIILDFAQNVDLATVAGALAFYPLTTAPDIYTLSARGTALTYTAALDADDPSRVILTVDFSTAPAAVEVYLDASKITFKNGTGKLNLDGDKVFGEAQDDDWNNNNTVIIVNQAPGSAAPTAVAIPTIRKPRASVVLGGALAGGINLVTDIVNYVPATSITFSVTDSGSAAALPNNTKITCTSAVTAFKNVAGVWTAAPVTTTYSTTTGVATVVFTTAPKAGEAYKVVLDKYNVYENAAVLGFVHRANTEQAETDPAATPSRYVSSYYTFVGGAAGANATLTPNKVGTTDYRTYIDMTVNAPNVSPIDLATVTAASLKVWMPAGTLLANGTAAPAGFYANYTITTLENTSATIFQPIASAVTKFRINLSADIKSFAGLLTPTVYVAPSVLSVDNTAVGAINKWSFGDVTNTAADGWAQY